MTRVLLIEDDKAIVENLCAFLKGEDFLVTAVDSPEYQTVLEKRYLCFQSWEQIVVEMGYDLRWLYRIHGKALEEVKAILGIE